MNLFVDTSVWSLALRRSPPAQTPEIDIEKFSLLPAITPELDDHVEAAALRNRCRRKGLQVGTIDAILAQLCIRHELVMLTTDRDFTAMARYCRLSLAGV